MSESQDNFLRCLSKCTNRIGSTTELARLMRTNHLAVVSIGRALERKGLVRSFRSDGSETAVLLWSDRRKWEATP